MSSEYAARLREAMEWLAEDVRTVFLGQSVACPGTFMSGTLGGVPLGKRIEMPVAEELQMGASLGLALAGLVPISVYPRWNFLLLAVNQLVNHVDKLPMMSGYRPRVIVRVGIGSARPMFPGPQHVGDYTEAFRAMLRTVHVERLDDAARIVPAYREALARDGSSVLVEHADRYPG